MYTQGETGQTNCMPLDQYRPPNECKAHPVCLLRGLTDVGARTLYASTEDLQLGASKTRVALKGRRRTASHISHVAGGILREYISYN